MIKQLPLLATLLLFFLAVDAQNQTDTVAKRPALDSAAKVNAVDSVAKNPNIDSLAKNKPADSIVTIKHQPSDSVVSRARVDSVASRIHADSVISHPVADSMPKHPIKTVNSRLKKTSKKSAVIIELKHSPIKSLSDKEYNMLLKGEFSNNMAIVGEINHYPIPDSALKYKMPLGLNPGQITKLKGIASDLHAKKLEMGDNVIRNEKMLDSLFHSHQVVDGTIIFYTNRYGLYQGEIRNAILQACYKTEAILSVVQIRKLESLEKIN